MLRPLIRPIVRPLVRGVTEPGYGSLAAQIRLLFASGEQGAWYDPSDLSTLYQDSAGTTPVTALGSPLGLMLDKSKGLVMGPERVTNGLFDSGTTGWAVSGAGITLSAVSGEFSIASTGAGGAYTSLATTVGKTYRLTGVGRSLAGMSIVALIQTESPGGGPLGGAQYIDSEAATPFEFVFTATATNHIVYLRSSAAGNAYWDNISVRELPGNHARQPTATARPTLQAGNKIDFDGVDDKLTTTFPDLGTNVTIARSLPGTGASILTGQTIGAGAWDDSTDSHALVIINRALTAPETALVTRWANMRAGV